MSILMNITRKTKDKYEISFHVSNEWYLKREITDSDLQQLADKINETRGVTSVMNLFNCSEKQALLLLGAWGEVPRREIGIPGLVSECDKCQYKRKECFKCAFICQSPLERTMFREFRSRGIDPILQRRIRKDGTIYDYPDEVDPETILTIPDFYLEGEKERVCIYADGKTYHYNNEHQGVRDRSIDIALQNLGFKVLRYTGSQIRENVTAVVDGILASIK